MRHIVALIPDAESCAQLYALSERLQAWDLPALWAGAADYALMVYDIGQLSAEDGALLRWSLDDWAGSCQLRSASCTGIGAFAGSVYPRTVYAAVDDAHGQFAHAHTDVADALAASPDAHYRPQLRLAAPNGGAPDQWQAMLAACGQLGQAFTLHFEAVALLARTPAAYQRGKFAYDSIAEWPIDR